MRRVAQNMMPQALVQFGLDVALRDHTTDVNKTGLIKIEYQSLGLEGLLLDQTTAINIYRIVQELVNNIVKHAQAQRAFIQLLLENAVLIINVDDNGIGFDKTNLQKSTGMGWKNILTRVEYMKGKIDIKTVPGKGSAVNIELNLSTVLAG
jgi:signal transduction histidine kinase